MKKFSLSFLLNFLISTINGDISFIPEASDVSFVASAISQIVEKVFSQEYNDFDIIIQGNASFKLKEIVDEMGKSIKFPHHQRTVYEDKLKATFINRSSILLYTSTKDYVNNVYKKFLLTQYQKNVFFLIYIEDQRELENNIFRLPGTKRFFHDYFLELTNSSILLTTYEIFHQPDCRKPKRIEVNRFLKSTLKWESEKFKMEKFKNINQCQLGIDTIYPQNLALSIDFNEKEPPNFRGYAIKLNDIISEKLNYTFKFNPTKKVLNSDSKYLHFDYHKYNNSYPDLSLEVSSFRKLQHENLYGTAFTITNHFTAVDEIVLISRSKPYSMLEKVFLPFEVEVWIWLIGSLAVFIIITTVVLLFTPTKVKKFVFGSKVYQPVLNIL